MLYLLEAWLRADAGDRDGVRDALDADLEFWRRALRDSDILLAKAIAESYVRRHFQWGNLILRRLPPPQLERRPFLRRGADRCRTKSAR